MRRRSPQHFYAFDILWLDGKDLRVLSLVKRKQILRRVVPTQPAPILYAEHFDARGVDLFTRRLRERSGRNSGKTEERSLHAGGNVLGQDQEPAVQPDRGSPRTV